MSGIHTTRRGGSWGIPLTDADQEPQERSDGRARNVKPRNRVQGRTRRIKGWEGGVGQKTGRSEVEGRHMNEALRERGEIHETRTRPSKGRGRQSSRGFKEHGPARVGTFSPHTPRRPSGTGRGTRHVNRLMKTTSRMKNQHTPNEVSGGGASRYEKKKTPQKGAITPRCDRHGSSHKYNYKGYMHARPPRRSTLRRCPTACINNMTPGR